MKKYYFTILLLLPFLSFAQISITSGITPDLSAYGEATNYPGEGEYQIFLSPDNILDKPIFVVDGFDPGDARDITGLYNSLDFVGTAGNQNLADLVRDEGFDVIILNFPTYTRTADDVIVDGGADFMERNAMVLVELIEMINEDKAGNSPEQNVILGPSMGGVIARYALNYMEANSFDADTRLYISFDSPHHGANVPIGLQHQLNFLAYNETYDVAEVVPLINSLLKSAAARQLLTDHLVAHLSGEDLFTFDPELKQPQPHPFRTIFNTNINALTPSGFPEMTRNVAIINGSGINNPYFAMGNSGPTVTNSYPVISTTLSIPLSIFTADILIDVNFTPEAGATNTVSSISIQILGGEIDSSIAESESFSYSNGVDAAPGGLFDLTGITGELGTDGGIASDFVNAIAIDKFNFIPSVSALAVEFTNDEINWNHTIDLGGSNPTTSTPFANTFTPNDNEPHVQLTEANVAFALDEILNPPLLISNSELIAIQLEKNPINGEIVLRSSMNSNANISIVDVAGKTVFNTTTTLNDGTSIPVDLASGFYILNVVTENNTRFVTKLIAQ
ncbi:T9SS type A sorting domain-containing protein [Winogradskyella thalassocola]|uniref:Por secretion system C-terminal sorting domain-containing protein n=1 Tax=Winogradskyella thalassocola TaxID=262004 RepID=A0A1G7Z5H0_9FLAO|nr:T9SS type A sorting domain-containing protein [Winogradskyella thalassocola]SDH03991.1 Por secretion system C-terminal sorting domain-containing protein [Winogradskyella thalassocola]